MGKRNKKRAKKGGGGDAWLVTFSDLVTLLLTFFVLLLSMSSMDKRIIAVTFSNFNQRIDYLRSEPAGRIPSRIMLTRKLLNNPWELFQKRRRIKELLFPDQVLPSDLNRSQLDENIKVLKRKEGVALVLSDKILFQIGSSEPKPGAERLLEQIRLLLLSMSAPVNISGHTDNTIGPGVDNYRLSARRALRIMDMLLQGKLQPQRFSVSAYGPDRPVATNLRAEGRQKNRRIEILLKTKPHTKTFL
jgi:chemotaxis protein MotB